jgi:hypothetical protein
LQDTASCWCAGQNTPLSGEILIVDDDDSSITYEGSWTQNTNMFTSSGAPSSGLPYGNSTHQTTSTGASATFRFTGMLTLQCSDGRLRIEQVPGSLPLASSLITYSAQFGSITQ